MNELDAMRDRILAEAEMARRSSWRVDILKLIATYTVVGIVSLGLGLHFFHAELTPVPTSLALILGATVVGTIAVVIPRRVRLWTGVGLLSMVVAAFAHLATLSQGAGRSFFADADCALAELAIASLPAVATVVLMRGFAYRWERAIVGGGVAALVGLGVLDLTCPAGGFDHVLVFHLLPATLVGIVAALVRHRSATRIHVP